jgi:hypothetical protein
VGGAVGYAAGINNGKFPNSRFLPYSMRLKYSTYIDYKGPYTMTQGERGGSGGKYRRVRDLGVRR